MSDELADFMDNHDPSEIASLRVESDVPLSRKQWRAEIRKWKPIARQRGMAITLSAPNRTVRLEP